MKKTYFLVMLIIASLLLVSFASASWWDSIFGGGVTGNVIADNTAYPNTNGCTDSDGGINATVAGAVSSTGFWRSSVTADRCSGSQQNYYDSNRKKVKGYPIIYEQYCDNGKKEQAMNSSTLGAGYCTKAQITIEGKSMNSAMWVSTSNFCNETSNGAINANGKKLNVCNGKNLTSYTCNDTSKEVITTITQCAVRCSVAGCEGNCTETDEANNKDVPGTVILDGKAYPDICINANTVKQYKCSQGRVNVVPYGKHSSFPCGVNRECKTNSNNQSYCADKYAGTATIETLSAQIGDMQDLIDQLTETIENLTARIDVLENPPSPEPTSGE
jgi:hypothetical protein